MSYPASGNRRAIVMPGLAFALFALALVFASTFHQPGVHAGGAARAQAADSSASQDAKDVEDDLRLLEHEFNRYMAKVEEEAASSGKRDLSQATLAQFWNRLSLLRNRAENLELTPEARLDLSNRIAILEERIRRAVEISDAQEPPPGTAAGSGAISGTVTDSGTSAPLANVTVQIYNSSGVFETLAVTDGAGNYTTPAVLPTGTHYARTSNSIGYINEVYNDSSCLPNCGVTSGTPISVTAGVTTPNINFALAAGGRISGTVVDIATFAPLANIEVDIYNADGTFITAGITDGGGNYISAA
ncbi:MAG TPA: carboxypeptidase-like regulatory domain-containing protein, partial [Blastocatellia bacterium]|nr:carboxypeptidase-like regulatory domain-containing protein [Blastocatellia bacterium]